MERRSIEHSYLALSRFFDTWVRIVEMPTRRMEVEDARLGAAKVLIISPPTDRGIRVLAEANEQGETYVLCFSAALEQIARRYAARHGLPGVRTCQAGFFRIPSEAGSFDAVFANCFFDFCAADTFDQVIAETQRALRTDGTLFAVYLDFPSSPISRLWVTLCRRFPAISQGCRPVDIRPVLLQNGFQVTRDLSLQRFGFPIKYIVARATGPWEET